MQTFECLYQLILSLQSQGFAPFPCPTPDQFRAEVAWPRDWLEAQAGEAPAEAPGDGEEARMDEEMTDLLDFLGGSGAMCSRAPHFLTYLFLFLKIFFTVLVFIFSSFIVVIIVSAFPPLSINASKGMTW